MSIDATDIPPLRGADFGTGQTQGAEQRNAFTASKVLSGSIMVFKAAPYSPIKISVNAGDMRAPVQKSFMTNGKGLVAIEITGETGRFSCRAVKVDKGLLADHASNIKVLEEQIDPNNIHRICGAWIYNPNDNHSLNAGFNSQSRKDSEFKASVDLGNGKTLLLVNSELKRLEAMANKEEQIKELNEQRVTLQTKLQSQDLSDDDRTAAENKLAKVTQSLRQSHASLAEDKIALSASLDGTRNPGTTGVQMTASGIPPITDPDTATTSPDTASSAGTPVGSDTASTASLTSLGRAASIGAGVGGD